MFMTQSYYYYSKFKNRESNRILKDSRGRACDLRTPKAVCLRKETLKGMGWRPCNTFQWRSFRETASDRK